MTLQAASVLNVASLALAALALLTAGVAAGASLQLRERPLMRVMRDAQAREDLQIKLANEATANAGIAIEALREERSAKISGDPEKRPGPILTSARRRSLESLEVDEAELARQYERAKDSRPQDLIVARAAAQTAAQVIGEHRAERT